jgi:sugar phosphate isomerase/epimerase
MAYRFRQAICNEVFEGWKLPDTCKAIRKAGYQGIEISPFTLSEFPATITPAQRREYRAAIEGEGLSFVGLHWLMVAPKGLHVTTPDDAVRAKSWQHIHDLIDLCADLAGDRSDNGIMVFGSPKQRGTTGGSSRADATKRWQEGLAGVAPHAVERRVTVLVEALPSDQCDVVNTLAEAARIVHEIGSPGVKTMFDTHNAADETEPHAAVVDGHFDLIRHVHVNEMDGRHPGTGNYDFKPVFDVLRRRNYSGWLSLEVFDFKAGAENIASQSLRYLENEIGKMAA